jgi:tetratricopeptide (TPR) repeat protein
MRVKALLFVALVTCSQALAGCFMYQTVPEERLKQALQLVDQGTIHLRQGKVRDAQVAFSMAEELAPIAAAVDGQGCVALLSGEFDRAERLFKRAYDMDSTYDHALANLALLKDISGQHDEAKRLYDEAIEALPESVAARNNRAALEYDRGARKMEVVEELQKAGLIADHPVVRENLSRLGSPMPERSEQAEPQKAHAVRAGAQGTHKAEKGEFVM